MIKAREGLGEQPVPGAVLLTDGYSAYVQYAVRTGIAHAQCFTDPDVPSDTNHLERALRPIALGRRTWLFCSTEVGAEAVATRQSLRA